MRRLDNYLVLIKNELIKIFAKKSTAVFIILLLGATTALTLLCPHKVSRAEYMNTLKSQVQNQQKEYGSIDGKDVEKEKNLFTLIGKEDYILNKYAVDNNITYNMPSLWSSVENVILLKYLIAIFLIVVSANIISSEYKEGTIKYLLIRPYSRWQILLSKWMTLVLIYFGLALFCIIVTAIAGLFKYGFNGMDTVQLFIGGDGQVHQRSMLLNELMLICGKSINDIMSITIAFMISTFVKNNSLAVIGSLGLLFSGFILKILGNMYFWIRFTPFPHMDLTQYMPESQPILPGNTLLISTMIIIVYFAAIQLLTFTVFQKGDIN